jgi:hypothetical protein
MTQTPHGAIKSAAIASLLLVHACGPVGSPELSVDIETLATPAAADSGEPFLSVSGPNVFLSWLESRDEGGHALRMSQFEGMGWGEASTVAVGDRFFVNWADFPSVNQSPDGTLWAHWLQRGPEGGYDYGVRVARSADGGATWSAPITPHDDDSASEHGFVSAMPVGEGMGFVWLDGRAYAASDDGSEPSNEMSLRYREISADGTKGAETLIDARVCDCCQTDAAMSRDGPVVVYRDRSANEIRDIYSSRLIDGEWTEGIAVHDDGWEISGCPVNGPAVAASGEIVAVAWFTAPGDLPAVKVAFSADGGANFGPPTVVDDGTPAGRVDLLMLDDGSALVTWLERTEGEQAEVRLRRVHRGGTTTESLALTSSSAGRASGFPRVVQAADGWVHLAWTDLSGDSPLVRVSRFELEK